VIIKGAAEDSTTARKVKPEVEKVLKAEVAKEMKDYKGFSQKVSAQNRGDDLVLVGEVLFP
jgi:hypothetical protein